MNNRSQLIYVLLMVISASSYSKEIRNCINFNSPFFNDVCLKIEWNNYSIQASPTTIADTDTCIINVPQVLSQNEDGMLKITCPCELRSFTFSLYNRWGIRVYHNKQLTKPLVLPIEDAIEAGTYYWTSDYTVMADGKAVKKSSKGSLTIIR